MKRRIAVLTALAVLGALAFSVGATADPVPLGLTYQTQATVTLNGIAKACDNTRSTIDIDGQITLGGLALDLTFENQDNNDGPGHHKKTASSTASLVLSNVNGLPIPKQPVWGGVGGNPWIYVSIDDGTTWVRVGRCVQGFKFKGNANVGAFAALILATLDCSNRGTTVDVGGDAGNDGVDVDLVFSNNAKWTHMAPGDALAHAELSPPVSVPKQGSVGGPGGNPKIKAQFKNDKGNPLGDWVDLGRCVQLNP